MMKWLAFLTLVMIYGSGFMFINIAVEDLTPLELSSMRFAFAAVLMSILLYASGRQLPQDRRGLIDVAVIGLVNNTVPFLLVAWAQTQGVDSGLTGVLIASNPLFTVVMAHFFFTDERMTIYKVVGLIVGFAGVVLLATRSIVGGEVLTDAFAGQLAVIFAAFCFAAAAIYSRRMMQARNIPPLAISTGTTVAAAISTVALWLLNIAGGTPVTDFNTVSGDTVIAMVILIVVHSSIAFSLVFYVIRELGATRSSLIAYPIPLVSLFLGATFLDETIDVRVIVATVLIVGSIAIANFGHTLVQRLRHPINVPHPPT